MQTQGDRLHCPNQNGCQREVKFQLIQNEISFD